MSEGLLLGWLGQIAERHQKSVHFLNNFIVLSAFAFVVEEPVALSFVAFEFATVASLHHRLGKRFGRPIWNCLVLLPMKDDCRWKPIGNMM